MKNNKSTAPDQKSDGMEEIRIEDVSLTHSTLFPVRKKAGSAGLIFFLLFLSALVAGVCLVVFMIGSAARPVETTGAITTFEEPVKTLPVEPISAPILTGISDVTTIQPSLITSEYAVVANATRGVFVAGKNATKKMYPASMTKIMTFLVAYDALPDRQEWLTLTKEIRNQYSDASRVGIDVGDRMTVEQCMYAMLLESDTDAVLMLALRAAGSETAFADLMNEKAAALGLTATHFDNATGLDSPTHYTTAAEMALIFAEALQNPLFVKIISTETYATNLQYKKLGNWTSYRMTFQNSTIKTRFQANNVPLMFGSGGVILGGKTGFTDDAGCCQAALGKIGENFYIVIAGKAPSGAASATDTRTLFGNYAK